jgi:hypothetical protein
VSGGAHPRRGAGAAALLGALLLATTAGAEPARPVRLTYAGVAGCPSEASLREAVRARLGRDPFRDDAPRSLVAGVTRVGRKLHGAIELREASGAVAGARKLEAADGDCEELVASMALAISIAIDPESALRPPPPPPPLSPRPPPAPQGATAEAKPPPPPPPLAAPLPAALPPAPPARPRASLILRGGTAVAVGLLPGPSVGAALDAGVRRGAFSVTLGAAAHLPASLGATGGGAVSAWTAAARLTPCVHAGWAAMCALASVGGLRGAGSGVSSARQGLTVHATLGARVALEIPLGGHLALAPHADLATPLTRTALQLAGADVWTTPAAYGAFGVGVVTHFP